MKKIGCLGPAGSFSHEAAIIRNGHNCEFVFFTSFSRLVESAAKGEIDEAAVPVDNLEIGIVSAGFDTIIPSNVTVVGELVIPIRHNLITLPGTKLEAITRVVSKMEAMTQCRLWLETNLPNAQLEEAGSTSAAVKNLDKYEPGTAAIGSMFATQCYDQREILAPNIHDNPNNVTHFLFISSDQYKTHPSGNDKTTMVFTIPDIFGALVDILIILKVLRINMSKIESVRTRNKLNDYLFWVDIDGHQNDPKIKVALEEMVLKSKSLKILGSYPKYEPTE